MDEGLDGAKGTSGEPVTVLHGEEPVTGAARKLSPSTADCCWQPDPAHGPPPACWIVTTTARQRLAHACAVLRWYGIAAHSALGDDPDVTRVKLREVILTDFPGADGAHLFWTAEDDDARLTPAGDLIGQLRVHIAGTGIAEAARAAFSSVGFTVADGPDASTLIIGLTG